ncbi:hypothetical protein RFF05_06780 [Bengtsoniella intestinalis]|uniref:hypothetical protein n=1 Tax=Bengtsoniella intestinalis TaxID=3073143 RepID=UPI00391F2E7F
MKHAVYFEFEEAGQENLAHVSKILAGVPGGVYQAVGSTIKRAAQRGLTTGMKIVAEEYAIGQNELKKQTKNRNTIVRDSGGSYEIEFGYTGYLIPLMKFDTKVSADGRVYSRVKRSSARTLLDNAFQAKMGSHTGIYERLGASRFPVEELFGPASVQAFYANEDTTDKMDAVLQSTFNSRIDHEITRVLNGW